MINVQPYLDKLEVFKEWIEFRIFNPGSQFWINVDAIPVPNTIEQVFRIYNETGILFFHSEPLPEPIYKELSFEEYFKSQQP